MRNFLSRLIDALPYGWGIAFLVLCLFLFLPFSLGRFIRGKW